MGYFPGMGRATYEALDTLRVQSWQLMDEPVLPPGLSGRAYASATPGLPLGVISMQRLDMASRIVQASDGVKEERLKHSVEAWRKGMGRVMEVEVCGIEAAGVPVVACRFIGAVVTPEYQSWPAVEISLCGSTAGEQRTTDTIITFGHMSGPSTIHGMLAGKDVFWMAGSAHLGPGTMAMLEQDYIEGISQAQHPGAFLGLLEACGTILKNVR